MGTLLAEVNPVNLTLAIRLLSVNDFFAVIRKRSNTLGGVVLSLRRHLFCQSRHQARSGIFQTVSFRLYAP
jgi:hypothetical protein